MCFGSSLCVKNEFGSRGTSCSMHLQGGAVASVLLPTCQANVRFRSTFHSQSASKRTLKRTRMSRILAMNKGTHVAGDTRATCHLHTLRLSRIPILNFSLNPIPPVFWGSVMRKTFLKHDSRFPPFRWKQGFHLRDLVPVSAFQCSTGIPGGINI